MRTGKTTRMLHRALGEEAATVWIAGATRQHVAQLRWAAQKLDPSLRADTADQLTRGDGPSRQTFRFIVLDPEDRRQHVLQGLGPGQPIHIDHYRGTH